MVRHRILATLVLSLALGALTPNSATAAGKLRIGKADSTDYDFALLQVGIDAGIFKKEGLEIETVTLPGARLHQAMTADSIDMALGSGTDFLFIAKGAPEKGVAAFAGAPINLAVLVRDDDKIMRSQKSQATVIGMSASKQTLDSRWTRWRQRGIGRSD